MANVQIELGIKDSGYSQALKDAKTKLQELNTQHGVTASKLGVANKNYNDAKKLLGDVILKYQSLSAEAKKSGYGKGLEEIIDNCKAVINETNKAKQAVRDLLDESNKKGGSGISSMGRNGASAVSNLGNVLSKAAGPVGTLGGGLQSLGSMMSGGLSMGAMAASAGLAAAGIAAKELVDITAEAVQKSAAFGQALSQLGAITGTSGKDLEAMRSQIRQLGAETDTSVVDVTNSMAKIGGAMPQLLDDTEGLGEVFKASSTLAKAGLMSQDDAIQSLTTSMSQFGLGSEDAATTVDVLANASQAGSAEISDLASTIKVCGTNANAAGISINQTAAMAEVLGDKALKGSEAGTQLRNIFANFSASGITSADGIMQELSKHAGDTTYMMKTFGKENMTAAQILAQGNERYQELLNTLSQSGTATQMAEQNTNNLAGSWDKLKIKWDNFLSSFNVDNADGICMRIVARISDLVTDIGALFEHLKNSNTIQAMFDSMGDAVDDTISIFNSCFNIISDVIDAIVDITDCLGLAENEFKASNILMDALKEAFAAIEMAIYGVRKVIEVLTKKFIEFKNNAMKGVSKIPLFDTLKKYVDKAVGYLKKVIQWWNRLKQIVQQEREAEANGKQEGETPKKEKPKKEKPKKNDPKEKDDNGGKGGGNSPEDNKGNNKGGGKTKKEDPIKAAEKKYAETINLAEKQEKLGIIQEIDFKKKKKQALDSLVNSYLEGGKNIDDKKVTDALSESKSLEIEIAKYEAFSDKSKTDTDAIFKRIEGRLEGNELFSELIRSQEKYVNDLNEIATKIANSKSMPPAPLMDGGDMSDEQRKTANEYNKVKSEYNKALNRLNELKVKSAQQTKTESDAEALRDYNDGLITAEEYIKKLIDSNDKLIQAISALQAQGIEPIYTYQGKTDEKGLPKLTELDLNAIKKNASNENTKLGKDPKQTPIRKEIEDIIKPIEQSLGDKMMGVKITPEMKFDELNEQYSKLQELFNEKYKLKISGAVEIPQEDLDELQSAMEDISGQMLDSFKEMNKFSLDDLGEGLDEFGSIVNYANGLESAFENADTFGEKLAATINVLTTSLQAYQNAMKMVETITKLFSATSVAAQQVENANTQQSVANSNQKAGASAGAALAGATEQGAKMPFPMNIVAIAMGVAAVVAALATTISSFAGGGIIGGMSNHGDMNLARVNGGEMILNGSQQSNLFNLLDDGGSVSSGGNVEFKIKGSDLYGTLRNYKNIKSKSGKNISI